MIKNIIGILFSGLFATTMLAQDKITVKVITKENKQAVVGASVYIKNTTKGATTDFDGIAMFTVALKGKQVLAVSYIGYKTVEKTLIFPLKKVTLIELEEDAHHLETILISSTRSKRNIAKIPTRIEIVGAEELGEKAIMNSANIAMLLRESTGIQMQQTSANSANQSIRIQGLDGRFTQLLKDGFPLFGGFSSGLSIMQIPPLDLKQVEIIKGSSSTLYGGGAIAGLINLISKQPKDEKEFTLMLDQTSKNGSTFNIFYSEKFNKFGFSIYASNHFQKETDVNNDHFSDLPKVKNWSINPSFYYYPNEKEQYRLSFSSSFEDRIGGDLDVITNNSSENHSFSEENISERYALQFTYTNTISDAVSFSLKNSISYFKRDLLLPSHRFDGEQFSTFTEATYSVYSDISDWVFGSNLITENFTEATNTTLDRSYKQFTFGGFTQNNWHFKENKTLETGFRTDYNANYGWFLLPRVSLFIEYSDKISSRIGGGFGYKIPTIFTEDAELRSFENVLPINPSNFKAEKSVGINADVNYKTKMFNGNGSLSFNQLFFYTKLNNSLLLEQQGPSYGFVNSLKALNSFGFESNLKIKYKDFILFTNYAFNDVKISDSQKVLTPKHSIGAVLMYEVEDKWRIGYEAYYKSSQVRTDSTITPNFWTMGFMIMRTFNKLSVYANFENFTDTKQSNYQSMTLGLHPNPTFVNIWAPTDGFVFNGGILIKL